MTFSRTVDIIHKDVIDYFVWKIKKKKCNDIAMLKKLHGMAMKQKESVCLFILLIILSFLSSCPLCASMSFLFPLCQPSASYYVLS